MSWVLVIILTFIVIYLLIKKEKRTLIDESIKRRYNEEVERLRAQKDDINKDIIAQREVIEEYQTKILEVKEQYNNEINKNVDDLNAYFANQKQLRQSELDTDFERQERERKESLDSRMKIMVNQAQEQLNKKENEVRFQIERLNQAQQAIANDTALQQERFESLLAPLKQYEMERQERLFYTIQVPDEYKDDIEFLLTTVAAKVQHPDIINKLVYAEYVKPYLDDTFKRIDIKAEPGIYKITSLMDGKCYIGKSTNIKKRLADHFKSSCGIAAIADQAVHHAIRKQGYWNWTIEPIIYCDKDKLSELEKYYIEFFKAQEFGYNRIL